MAKRVVQECDLCKGEYDPDETHSIAVKKKGKSKANAYDLCPDCAEKIQQQLVAKSSDGLAPDWSFAAPLDQSFLQAKEPSPARGSRREEVTAEQQEDDDLIARKNAERAAAASEAGQSIPEQAEAPEVPYETVAPEPLEDGSCPHMNRGPIRPRGGQFLQECRDCGADLLPNTSDDRGSYMAAKPGRGVNLSTHASDRRNRD
jgi:hypothetical protein